MFATRIPGGFQTQLAGRITRQKPSLQAAMIDNPAGLRRDTVIVKRCATHTADQEGRFGNREVRRKYIGPHRIQ